MLSAYAVFLGPMTGCMIASYLVVNRRKIAVDDLYRGDSGSIYWYTWGVNWRAPIAVRATLPPPSPPSHYPLLPNSSITPNSTFT